MNNLKKIFTSKKFWAMAIGLIVTVLISVIPALEPMQDNLAEIIGVIVAYILGQGLADFGKEAK